MSDKKYEIDRSLSKTIILNTPQQNEVEVYRIVALVDFSNVKKGDIGGLVESEDNLSQEGDCWIYGDAEVSGNAKVERNAVVAGNAKVYGNAVITNNAEVYENAIIRDNAKIHDCAKVHGYTVVCDDAKLCDHANVYGNSNIQDHSDVRSCATIINAIIKDHAIVACNAYIKGNVRAYTPLTYTPLTVSDNALVDDCAHVLAYANISGKSQIRGNATVDDNAVVKGDSIISGCSYIGGHSVVQDSMVNGYATIDGYAVVRDSSIISCNARITDSAVVSNSSVYGHARINCNGTMNGCILYDNSLITDMAHAHNSVLTDSAVVKDNVVVDGNYNICGNCKLTGNETYTQDTTSVISPKRMTPVEIGKKLIKIKDPSDFIEKKKPTVFEYITNTDSITDGCFEPCRICFKPLKLKDQNHDTVLDIITTFNMFKYNNVSVHFETVDGYDVNVTSYCKVDPSSITCVIYVKSEDVRFLLKIRCESSPSPQLDMNLYDFIGLNVYDAMKIIKKIMDNTDFSKHLKESKEND